MRLAWDTETGERVAVKIVERQSRKRLGGGSASVSGAGGGLDWSARMAARQQQLQQQQRLQEEQEEEEASHRAEQQSNGLVSARQPSTSSSGSDAKGKGRELEDGSADAAENPMPSGPSTRFAPEPVPSRSPELPSSRLGRWMSSAGAQEDHAGAEETAMQRAKRQGLWTTDQKVKREIAIMKKCSHQNVVQLKEVIDDPQSKKIFMGELIKTLLVCPGREADCLPMRPYFRQCWSTWQVVRCSGRTTWGDLR